MKFLNEIDGAHQLKTDASNRLVTDTEKSNWNAKASTSDIMRVSTTKPTNGAQMWYEEV